MVGFKDTIREGRQSIRKENIKLCMGLVLERELGYTILEIEGNSCS
jgi:hypothetical protein